MSNKLREYATALNNAASQIAPTFGKAVSPVARERVMNALDNMRKYPSILSQLSDATQRPGASDADWRKQVDAILYSPMDDDAAQKLVALIELVDADAKYH